MTRKIKYPKLLIFVIGLFCLWVLVYKFTWENTLHLNSEVNFLQQELNEFEEKKRNSGNPELEPVLLVGNNDSLDFQHEILAVITKSIDKRKAEIYQFSELQKVKTNDMEVQIQPVILQGEFYGLLNVLHDLEQNYKGLNVSSANLYLEKNKKSKRNELFLKIYVQKLI